MVVYFKANTVNTGAATLNVNSLGAKTIVKGVSTTLNDGDIAAGQFCTVIYDGTNFVTLHRVIDYAFTTHVEATDEDFNPPLNGILTMVFKFAEHYNIDIEKYVMWKLDYNLNREYMHGKKF